MYKSIGYHTRLSNNNSVKVVGGSFGGGVDQDTIERLIKAHFKVIVKNSGRCVFVDREGREVSLYLAVDPEKTQLGQVAIKAHRKLKEAEQQKEVDKMLEVEELLSTMTAEEILGKLCK